MSKPVKFGREYFDCGESNYPPEFYNIEYHQQEYWKNYWNGLLKKILKFTKNKKGKFLDVGCGKGIFLHFADKFNFKTFGTDVSAYALKEARKATKAKLVVGNAEGKIPFPENYFDVVSSIETVEHLKNPGKMFLEVHRILKLGGIFLFTTPSPHSLRRLVGKFVDSLRDKDPTHISIMPKWKWRKLLNEANLRVVEFYTEHFLGRETFRKHFKIDLDKIIPFGRYGYVFICRKED